MCYNCDEKWHIRHKSKGAKLFLLEEISMEVEPRALGVQLVEITNDEVLLEPQGEIQRSGVDKCGIDPAEISLYALIGCPNSNTMRVRGRIKKQEVVSLINSGSTYNFLDASMLPRLQLQLDTFCILEVNVANVLTCWWNFQKFLLSLLVYHLLGVMSMVLPSRKARNLSMKRPYRYPYFQKSEIEKIVNELREVAYIQPSQSPFSSPVLLVRKANGS